MALLHTLLLPLVLMVGSLTGDGWLGIKLADADRPTIEEVIPDSPAAKAGLRHGDVIVSIDGEAVRTVDALVEVFQELDAGDWIKLAVRRRGKSIEMKIQLSVRPVEDRESKAIAEKPAKKAAKKPAKPPAQRQAKQDRRPAYLGVELEESSRGIIVTDLIGGAPAVRAGVRRGDRLRSLNKRAVRDLDQLAKVMDALHANDRIRLELVRGGRQLVLEFRAGARPAAKPAKESRGRDRAPTAKPRKESPPTILKPGPAATLHDTPSEVVPKGGHRDQSTEFGTSLEQALTNARRTGRPVIAIFGANWCVNCETLKKSLKHSSLKGVLSRYERVWIDTDKESALADKYKIESLPHTIFFTSDGEQRETVVRGYQPPQILLSVLRAGLKDTPASDERRPTRRTAKVEPPKRARPRRVTDRASDRVAPRRVSRPVATANANSQAQEIQRLRNEIQQLRTEQRRLGEMMRRLQRELQRKK